MVEATALVTPLRLVPTEILALRSRAAFGRRQRDQNGKCCRWLASSRQHLWNVNVKNPGSRIQHRPQREPARSEKYLILKIAWLWDEYSKNQDGREKNDSKQKADPRVCLLRSVHFAQESKTA